jgi:hypothetical protein
MRDENSLIGKMVDNSVIDQSMPDIVYQLLVMLPEQLKSYTEEIEIYELNKEFIDEIIEKADLQIGQHLEFLFDNTFNVPYRYTLRELFLHIIIKYDLSFKNRESYIILDRLIVKNKNIGNYSMIMRPLEIKLSSLMGHRFDGYEYSFAVQNISKLVMKSDNYLFFKRVVRMMRYLTRHHVLVIDYPQYYEFINGEQLVLPYSLDKLHRTSNKNVSYYSNIWIGAAENKSEHSNAIMAILSYIKYCMERDKT